MCGGFVSCGDAGAALARADVVVEGRFRSGFVEHAYIEPEAGYAVVRDGRVEIYACTQAPVMDLESLAEILAMPRDASGSCRRRSGAASARSWTSRCSPIWRWRH